MTTSVVDDLSLPGLIEQEVARAIGHMDGTLASERQKELEYYLGRPFGNEVEGESQVVSTDVADTIEAVLPAIIAKFTSSDDAVIFEPEGPEDEEAAKQRTDTVNYVFHRQNPGFVIFYEWFKDALMQKNGVVKYYYEEKYETTEEEYQGLTEQEYQGLVNPKDGTEIEVIEESNYDDPVALEQIEAGRQQLMAQIQPGQEMLAAPILAQVDAIPVPQLHDVKVKITKDVSKVCVETVPPEEFGISAKHNCISIQQAPFVYHRSRKTVSYLRSMGCPEEILDELSYGQETDTSPEAIARDRFIDSAWRDSSAPDPASREVVVTECYFRVDYDGDGEAELRHIIMPGRSIWVNEPCSHIPFAAITPIIMPHRFTGRSLSELMMDIQFTKSVLQRQMLNNLYLTNNPRKAVLSSAAGIVQANLDDLLTSRPGGIMREYVPNAIRNEEVPFVAGAAFPMLEYLDGVKEERTGSTRYNQGTDADSLNKTARGIAMIQSAGQQRLDLIARIFAETGVKDLMRGIAYMLSKYSMRALTIKLRNQWVDIDPREWKHQFNMTVNVGLGTGSKDVQLAHLTQMGIEQKELIAAGRGYMVSDENIFNLYTKKSEAMGFKHPELFITDPKAVPPEAKQAPMDPKVIEIQLDAQSEKEKRQLEAAKEQHRADLEVRLETIRQQGMLAKTQLDNECKERIELAKLQAGAQQAQQDAALEVNKTNNDNALRALELDARENDLAARETIFKMSQNIDAATATEKEKVAVDNDSRLAEHTSALMQQVAESNAQVGAQIQDVAQLLAGAVQLLQQQVAESKQQTKNKLAPRRFRAETDADGRIVGGEFTVN